MLNLLPSLARTQTDGITLSICCYIIGGGGGGGGQVDLSVQLCGTCAEKGDVTQIEGKKNPSRLAGKLCENSSNDRKLQSTTTTTTPVDRLRPGAKLH